MEFVRNFVDSLESWRKVLKLTQNHYLTRREARGREKSLLIFIFGDNVGRFNIREADPSRSVGSNPTLRTEVYGFAPCRSYISWEELCSSFFCRGGKGRTPGKPIVVLNFLRWIFVHRIFYFLGQIKINIFI